MEEKDKVIIRDRRRNKRTNKPLKFRIIPEDASHDIMGETKDLSCIGANCKMNKFIPSSTRVHLTLEFPDGDESFEGVVVRSEKVNVDEYNVAIYFSEIDFGIRKKIDRFVSGQEKNLQDFEIDG
jgi:c-di-GMP-binding flagellar brake protein YcgR